jgi:hypothetical protein
MTTFTRSGSMVLVMAMLASGCAGTGTGAKTDVQADRDAVGQEQRHGGGGGGGERAADDSGKKAKERLPWMVAPLFSSTPKLGTAYGAMAGYLHRFDERSRVSKFGLSAQYTSTDSIKASLVAQTSFREDRHRANLSLSGGRINNDYEDYLGTGIELENVESALGLKGNYLYRFTGNWFAGAQAAFSNYKVVGQSPSDDETLEILGISGLRSGGVGAVIQNDTRDNDNRPTRGWVVNLDTMAFREKLGGDYDYEVYRFDLRGYWGQSGGHVFAARQNNQWTIDAPLEAESSIALRGYKQGQYLGRYSSSIEVEERFHIAKRWGATLFAGLGCLYGDGVVCTKEENLYPSCGAGIQFVLVPKEGIVGNLEYGWGKDDNSGAYLKVGYAF